MLWPYFEKAIRLTEQNFDVLNEKKKYNRDEITGLRNIVQKTEYLFTIDLFQVISMAIIPYFSVLLIMILLQNLIDSMANKRTQIGPQAMTQFSKQFHSYLQNALSEISSNLLSTANLSASIVATPTTIDFASLLVDAKTDQSKMLLKLNTMAILYHHLLGSLDQKLFNSIVDCNTKVKSVERGVNMIKVSSAFPSYR